MRLLAFIMAFLTLQLSMGTCCEPEDPCAEPAHTETRQTSMPSEDGPGSEGPCSPFYTCGACPGCIRAEIVQFDGLKLSFPKPLLYSYYLEIVPVPNTFLLLRPPIEEFS